MVRIEEKLDRDAGAVRFGSLLGCRATALSLRGRSLLSGTVNDFTRDAHLTAMGACDMNSEQLRLFH